MAEREEGVVGTEGRDEGGPAVDSSVDPEPSKPAPSPDGDVTDDHGGPQELCGPQSKQDVTLWTSREQGAATQQEEEEEEEQTIAPSSSPFGSTAPASELPAVKPPGEEEHRVHDPASDIGLPSQWATDNTTLASTDTTELRLIDNVVKARADDFVVTSAEAATITKPASLTISEEVENTSTTISLSEIPETTGAVSPTPVQTESTKIAAYDPSSALDGVSSFGDVESREAVSMEAVQTQVVNAASSTPPQPPQQQTTTAPVGEKSATCKYRWGKVVPTNSKRIIFFCSAHPNEPVFLHWSPQHQAYYSEELTVPCGDYAGHVIVEGKTHPVEAFGVRSYTFEVDLFLKEDVIEDEVATSNSLAQELKFQQQQQQQQGPVDTYRDISSSALTSPPKMEENGTADDGSNIRHNSKYEDLLRQQLQHKESLDASLENELTMSQKTEQLAGGSGSKRLTPVGDIDKEPFQDGYSSLPVGDNSTLGRNSERRTMQHTYSVSASDLRQDLKTDRHSMKSSELSGSRHSFGDAPVGDIGLPKSLSRSGSDLSGGLGSGHLTPKQDSYESPSGTRPGSGIHTPVDRRIDDVLGGTGSHSSSVRHTPIRETIGDVLGSEVIPPSPARSLASGSARQTPERDVGLLGSSRSTPQRETVSAALLGGQERLYGSQELLGQAHSLPGSRPVSQLGSRPDSRPASVAGSQAGSQHSSRAQSLNSLTSEQELSQFLDSNNSHQSAGRQPIPMDTHPDESSTLPPIMRDRDRPSSLPTHATQSPIGVDKRTYTPDHSRSPLALAAGGMADFQRDLPPRGTNKSALSSRASSRTLTPVFSGLDMEQESAKVRDLEETVATLRKLLGSREQEVHELQAQLRDLKDINQSLKTDLDHARSRRIPAGSDDLGRQYEQLLQEKEILAGEVVKLRDRLESTRGTGVDSFSSQSSTSLQRRIDELEAHIRDLRHSNDSTTQRLLRSEKRVKEVMEENDKLRSVTSLQAQDLQDDRGGHYGDRHHQIEVQQLKEDVRTLRDRNYALQDEILRFREGKEPSRTPDFRSRGEHLLKDLAERARAEELSHQRPATESLLRDRSSALQSLDLGRPKHLALSDPPTSPGRRLDRSYGSETFPGVSARDPVHRSLDLSFGSDQGSRDILRETSSYSRTMMENGDRELKVSSDRLNAKYRDYADDRGVDIRRTANRYDILRSRPDGEVSEKLLASDAGRYGTLSAEKLRSFDRERERGDSKVAMSAERLRILEEAERNRERRAQVAASTAGRRTVSADNPISSKDDTRQRKSDANHSDDSDSTSVLMSFDVKADTFSGQREREKSAPNERSRSQEMYYDRAYLVEKEQEKQRDREFRDLRSGHRETNGEDSDTATDILLSVEPGKMAAHSSSRRRRRHPSIGDDASFSSISDGEDPQDSLRRRSKSADGKVVNDDMPGFVTSRILMTSLQFVGRAGHKSHIGKKGPSHYGQTTSLRPANSTEMLGSSKSMTLSSGFRTVTPQPLTTQHNKNAKLQRQQDTLSSTVTQGLRPFAPRSPGDVRMDDMVKFSRQGGKLSQGTVKFVGHLPGRSDVYLGVELYKEEGKHDGKFEGIRYFRCKSNKGVFVAFNKVVMAWAQN